MYPGNAGVVKCLKRSRLINLRFMPCEVIVCRPREIIAAVLRKWGQFYTCGTRKNNDRIGMCEALCNVDVYTTRYPAEPIGRHDWKCEYCTIKCLTNLR